MYTKFNFKEYLNISFLSLTFIDAFYHNFYLNYLCKIDVNICEFLCLIPKPVSLTKGGGMSARLYYINPVQGKSVKLIQIFSIMQLISPLYKHRKSVIQQRFLCMKHPLPPPAVVTTEDSLTFKMHDLYHHFSASERKWVRPCFKGLYTECLIYSKNLFHLQLRFGKDRAGSMIELTFIKFQKGKNNCIVTYVLFCSDLRLFLFMSSFNKNYVLFISFYLT